MNFQHLASLRILFAQPSISHSSCWKRRNDCHSVTFLLDHKEQRIYRFTPFPKKLMVLSAGSKWKKMKSALIEGRRKCWLFFLSQSHRSIADLVLFCMQWWTTYFILIRWVHRTALTQLNALSILSRFGSENPEQPFSSHSHFLPLNECSLSRDYSCRWDRTKTC